VEAEPAKIDIKELLKFNHQAMHTEFEVFIQYGDGIYAGRAVRAAFNEVDRLEGLLSRYIENSDVSRINRLKPGQSELVSEETMQCLLTAQEAYRLTGGAFDVAMGAWIDYVKKNDENLPRGNQPCMDQLKLYPPQAVEVLDKNVSIDLGGIGKGYAVDAIAQILHEWGIPKALIHGGASSIRALKHPAEKKGWPVVLSDPTNGKTVVRLEMAEEVLSCSGLRRGLHIVNPFTGEPVKDRRACWIRLPQNAALADALSTAGMIMPIEDVRRMRNNLKGCSVMILPISEEAGSKWIQMGDWPVE
jgi:thiamine biosynthesis lipoprotein